MEFDSLLTIELKNGIINTKDKGGINMKIRVFLCVLLVLVLSLSLISCENRVTKDEAKEQVNKLLDAVVDERFDDAKSLLHPKRAFDVQDLFERAEAEYNVDFQDSIELERYTGFSSAVYSSEVDGSSYELEMDIVVSGKALELTVEVVRNNSGFGIYDIEIDD